MDAQVSPSSSASDTGFDELMDMPFFGRNDNVCSAQICSLE